MSYVSKYNRAVANNDGQEFKQVASKRERGSRWNVSTEVEAGGSGAASEQPVKKREEQLSDRKKRKQFVLLGTSMPVRSGNQVKNKVQSYKVVANSRHYQLQVNIHVFVPRSQWPGLEDVS